VVQLQAARLHEHDRRTYLKFNISLKARKSSNDDAVLVQTHAKAFIQISEIYLTLVDLGETEIHSILNMTGFDEKLSRYSLLSRNPEVY
jgi:hypothetical protein